MEEEEVTISAKVKKDFQDRLDRIGRELGASIRLNAIRSRIEYFMDSYELGRIPAAFRISKEDDGSGRLRTEVGVCSGLRSQRAVKSEDMGGDSR